MSDIKGLIAKAETLADNLGAAENDIRNAINKITFNVGPLSPQDEQKLQDLVDAWSAQEDS